MIARVFLSLVAAALLAVVPATADAAPAVTEYHHATSGQTPSGIAAATDGSLWFTTEANPGSVVRYDPASPAFNEYAATSPGLFTPPPYTPNGKPTRVVTMGDGSVWFTLRAGDGSVVRRTAAGAWSEWTNASLLGLGPNSEPYDIAVGSDGAVWFTQRLANKIGRISPTAPAGSDLQAYALPAGFNSPRAITPGPDGALWFTGAGTDIGRIATDGTITTYPTTGLSGTPQDIVAGPDGALWFTESGLPGAIVRMTTAGAVQRFPLGLFKGEPRSITVGGDGNLWFTQTGTPGAIGRITPGGQMDEYAGSSGVPADIATAADGTVWFSETGGTAPIARITVGPRVSTSAPGTVTQASATLNGMVKPNALETTYRFEYGLTDTYGSVTTDASAGSTGEQAVSAVLQGLTASTTYHFRLTATNAADTHFSAEGTFTTAAAPPSPPPPAADPAPPAADPAPPAAENRPADGTPAEPEIGKSVVVREASGTVRVRAPGSDRFVALRDVRELPLGAIVDARRGVVLLASALPGGGQQDGEFWGGTFSMRQTRSGMMELALRGPVGCGARQVRNGAIALSSAVKRKRKVRRLWGKDDGGKFRTRGANSVATVRGTEWVVANRCRGTLTRVKEGTVVVRDLVRRRTVVVEAGGRYLARPRR